MCQSNSYCFSQSVSVLVSVSISHLLCQSVGEYVYLSVSVSIIQLPCKLTNEFINELMSVSFTHLECQSVIVCVLVWLEDSILPEGWSTKSITNIYLTICLGQK